MNRFALGLTVCVALCTIGFIGCQEGDKEGANEAASSSTVTDDESENASSEGDKKMTEVVKSNYSDSVLRHAVFFKFKDESSEADIQGVTDAFAALPKSIPEIIDFQWGVNNSGEGHDNGFTHCFLLTFKDESGRDVYLPHAAHKAFVDVLRPHMADVFVIDYFGKAADSGIEKELKHCVFFKFKDDAAADDVEKVENAFAALPGKVDAIKDFEWGKNNSPESHDDGFTHCFMVTFDSEDGIKEYLPHPDHVAFVEVLKPVLDKVRVLDFWETK